MSEQKKKLQIHKLFYQVRLPFAGSIGARVRLCCVYIFSPSSKGWQQIRLPRMHRGRGTSSAGWYLSELTPGTLDDGRLMNEAIINEERFIRKNNGGGENYGNLLIQNYLPWLIVFVAPIRITTICGFRRHLARKSH